MTTNPYFSLLFHSQPIMLLDANKLCNFKIKCCCLYIFVLFTIYNFIGIVLFNRI